MPPVSGAKWKVEVVNPSGGSLAVEGATANGAAPTENPVLVAGWDGALKRTLFTDTTGRQVVVGAAAAGAAIAGNPVLQGLSDGTLARAVLGDTSGRTVVAGAETDGSALSGAKPQLVCFGDGTNARVPVIGQFGNNDAVSASTRAVLVATHALAYNGASWSAFRGNVESLVVTRAAQTTSYTGSDRVNYNGRGITGYLNVTVNPGGAETLTFALQVKDEAGGDGYVTVASSGAISVFGTGAGATGLEVIMVYPGAVETAGITGWTTQALKLPKTYRWLVTHSASGAWSYTIADCVEV